MAVAAARALIRFRTPYGGRVSQNPGGAPPGGGDPYEDFGTDYPHRSRIDCNSQCRPWSVAADGSWRLHHDHRSTLRRSGQCGRHDHGRWGSRNDLRRAQLHQIRDGQCANYALIRLDPLTEYTLDPAVRRPILWIRPPERACA